MLLRPKIFQPFAQLVAGQSTRHGGISPSPFNSLNLGKSTADAPENLAENRRRFCAALGFVPAQLAWSIQVHGTEIRQVESPGGAEGFDALVATRPGILLAVSVADCTPILVFDKGENVVAAIHAGWRGTVGGIVHKSLIFMEKTFGSRPESCLAFVGPCIAECSFEVGEDVAVHFAEPFKRWDAARQKFFVDLKKANAAQLRAFGLTDGQIEISPHDTFRENDRFFSHRADGGNTGRMLAAIGLLD